MKEETLKKQVDRLAEFIMVNIDGEPSQSQGAVDTAIRLLKANELSLNYYKRQVSLQKTRSKILGENLKIQSKRMDSLMDCLKIQCANGNWNYDPYMMGLANGMILAQHILIGGSGNPTYLDAPKKWLKEYPSWFTKLKWKLFPKSMIATTPSEGKNNL